MRQFISKVIHFITLMLGLMAVLCFCLNLFPSSWSPPSYSITQNIKYYLEGENDKEVVVIGDSRAMAGIAPKDIDSTRVYNLSVSGGTPISGYYTLQKLVQHQKAIQTIIISYAPFHLIRDDTYPRLIAEDFYSFDEINTIYNTIRQENTSFWDHDKLNYSKFNSVNLLNAYLIKIKFPTFFMAEIRTSAFLRSPDNRRVKRTIEKNMGAYLYGDAEYCAELNQETSYDRFNANAILSTYLGLIFELAQSNNIQVIFITAPVNRASESTINQDFSNDYLEYFSQLEQKYPDVLFYSQLRSYGNEYFGDESHLNARGRLKFSKEVKSIVNGTSTLRENNQAEDSH